MTRILTAASPTFTVPWEIRLRQRKSGRRPTRWSMVRDHSLVQLRSHFNDLFREMGQGAETTPNSWKAAYSPGGGGGRSRWPRLVFIRSTFNCPRAVQAGLKDLLHLP